MLTVGTKLDRNVISKDDIGRKLNSGKNEVDDET